jgi:pyridoxamine 5'-phosphate oxidase family protein
MSIFTAPEIEYLQSQTMGRLATVGADGQPHVIPLTFVLNTDEGSIDLGGIAFASGKKWRDMQGNPRITFLVDDAVPGAAHAVEIRSRAELHETGGSRINPRFTSFVEEFVRLRPTHIVSWGLVPDPSAPMGTEMSSRRVG